MFNHKQSVINIYSLLNLHVLEAQEFLLIGVHSLKMFIACPFGGFDPLKNVLLNSLSLKLYFSCNFRLLVLGV